MANSNKGQNLDNIEWVTVMLQERGTRDVKTLKVFPGTTLLQYDVRYIERMINKAIDVLVSEYGVSFNPDNLYFGVKVKGMPIMVKSSNIQEILKPARRVRAEMKAQQAVIIQQKLDSVKQIERVLSSFESKEVRQIINELERNPKVDEFINLLRSNIKKIVTRFNEGVGKDSNTLNDLCEKFYRAFIRTMREQGC